MGIDWDSFAKQWWDEQPHPRGHGLKIGEFATMVKLATMAKFGGHAEPHEAALFAQEFKASGLTQDEFERGLDQLAPLSFAFHGRPPTMKEMFQLKDRQPHEARRYFADLPDKHHPEITAGDMVKAYQAARPWSREHLDREPVKSEVAYQVHSGEHPAAYYARIAAQQPLDGDTIPSSGDQTQERSDSGGRGVAAPGRPAADQ